MLQFEAFARGFMMLCGGPAIHLFSATELERLVCGNPLLDFDAMQANARYDGGYSPEHRVSHPGAFAEMESLFVLCGAVNSQPVSPFLLAKIYPLLQMPQ